MEFPPDPVYVDAINKALASTQGKPFHIDAIARALGGDVQRDRDTNGMALSALVSRGYLDAVDWQPDQGVDYPIYYKGWTDAGKTAIAQL